MAKKAEEYIKTGDYPIIDEWVNNVWPSNAKSAIKSYIADYRRVVKFRTSMGVATISRPIADSFQIVINYNSAKKCYIVWNAAIQNKIHNGKKKRLTIGGDGEALLRKAITPDSITPFFRKFRLKDSNAEYVEMIFLVGQNAITDFCANYKDMIVPNEEQIPAGKTCLYAVAGGEIEYIQGSEI